MMTLLPYPFIAIEPDDKFLPQEVIDRIQLLGEVEFPKSIVHLLRSHARHFTIESAATAANKSDNKPLSRKDRCDAQRCEEFRRKLSVAAKDFAATLREGLDDAALIPCMDVLHLGFTLDEPPIVIPLERVALAAERLSNAAIEKQREYTTGRARRVPRPPCAR